MTWGCEWGFPWGTGSCELLPQLTSGSWTYEAHYRFPLNPITGVLTSPSQSLFRLHETGSVDALGSGSLGEGSVADEISGTIGGGAAILNVIAVSASSRIELWARPTRLLQTANCVKSSCDPTWHQARCRLLSTPMKVRLLKPWLLTSILLTLRSPMCSPRVHTRRGQNYIWH